MTIIKNIILLPLLPLRLAWKWSDGAKVTSGSLWNKKDEYGSDIVIEKADACQEF